MQHITSRQNPIVARYRAARDRNAASDPILLDGVHLVGEALAAGLPVRDVIVARDAIEREDVGGLLMRFSRARVEPKSASPSVMSALSPLRSPSPIVALTDPPAADEARLFRAAPALIVVVSHLQDPGNLGAIMRVAEAAGATGLIATGGSADIFGWKAVRGSMGSALRLPMLGGGAWDHRTVRRHGCRVVATVPRDGVPVFDANFKGPTAILVGGEGAGLDPAIVNEADERITIPMTAPVESLNAAVSAAIILYEARRQRS